MRNDFFVSYSSEDAEKVQSIVESLEKRGLKCWYAPRDVVGRYAKAIVDAIDNSKVFLICLSKYSVVSEHVLNEVEMVYNKMRSSNNSIIIEPLCLEELDMDSPEYDEIMYYIRRINFITPNDFSSGENIADEIFNKNRKVLQTKKDESKSREAVTYITSENERERLKLQNELLRDYDKDVYDEILSKHDKMDILDIGCGNADVITDRLANYNGTVKIVGVERDIERIEEGEKKHSDYNITYLQADVDSPDFYDDLLDLMDEEGIEGFDLIHISMFLMYLKDVKKILRRVKRLLKKDGTLLIKDVDDGLNYAYPDDRGMFETAYKICATNQNAGYRFNGRQVLHSLLKSGVENIEIKRQGLTTLGMSKEKKDTLFDLYFRPILLGLEDRANNDPLDADVAENLMWFKEHYALMHDAFVSPEFIFSLGIVIYVARL